MDCEWLSVSPGFPGSSAVKDLPANAGDMALIPGSGRDPGEGNNNPLQYSREIPWTEEPGWLQSMGPQKSWTRLSDLNNNTLGSSLAWLQWPWRDPKQTCNKILRDHHMGKVGHRIWRSGKPQQGKELENHQPTLNKKAHANHKQKCQFTLSGSVLMPWKRKPTHTSRVGREPSWPRGWHS